MTTTVQVTQLDKFNGWGLLMNLHDATHSSLTVHTITQQGQVYVHLLALIPSPSNKTKWLHMSILVLNPSQQITDRRSLSPGQLPEIHIRVAINELWNTLHSTQLLPLPATYVQLNA